MDENKTPEQTPEQLLKMMELQMQFARSAREQQDQNRNMRRVVAIASVLIVLGAILLAGYIYANSLERPKKVQPVGANQIP